MSRYFRSTEDDDDNIGSEQDTRRLVCACGSMEFVPHKGGFVVYGADGEYACAACGETDASKLKMKGNDDA